MSVHDVLHSWLRGGLCRGCYCLSGIVGCYRLDLKWLLKIVEVSKSVMVNLQVRLSRLMPVS